MSRLNRTRRHQRRVLTVHRSLFLAAAGTTSLAPQFALAPPRTWDGGGNPDVNWSTALNWDGDASAPVAGDSLTFDGTLGLSNNNDLAVDTSFAGITFAPAPTSGAFTLNGNEIVLGGNVTNSS